MVNIDSLHTIRQGKALLMAQEAVSVALKPPYSLLPQGWRKGICFVALSQHASVKHLHPPRPEAAAVTQRQSVGLALLLYLQAFAADDAIDHEASAVVAANRLSALHDRRGPAHREGHFGLPRVAQAALETCTLHCRRQRLEHCSNHRVRLPHRAFWDLVVVAI